MIVASSIDSASSWLWWSNIMYIGGAVLTLGAAMHVRHEKRRVDAGMSSKVSFASEASVIAAALVSLAGTAGAIYFGDRVSHYKDVDLATYKTGADIKIAQTNKDAAKAISDAATANQKAEEAKTENLKLEGQVGQDAARARTAEAALEAKNKETSDFAHSLQQQQATMQQQAVVSPQLTSYQIQALANLVRPFAGQDVTIHQTSDTVVARLGATINAALNRGGVTTKGYSTDMGALYQGVSVAVHDAKAVPALANALVMGFRQAGIDVHPVTAPDMVQTGQVGIFLGPN